MKRNVLVGLILAVVFIFAACNSEKKAADAADSERSITGFNGEKIILPPAEDIKRVVVMAPPSFSFVLNSISDKQEIVGANPYLATLTNKKIMAKLFPKWENVNTSFMLENSFNANIEELLKLKPDIIIYNARVQGAGMEKLNVPLINMPDAHSDIEKLTIEYERVVKEIFDIKSENVLEKKWHEADKKVEALINKNQKKKTALFIWKNMDDQVSIFGKNTYVDWYCDKLNLKNVAEELNNYPNISMEQIYAWNPDYIFNIKGFGGSKNAKEILAGQDSKNWTKLSAFQK